MNHESDLVLVGAAVACDRKFDFIGSEFEDREVMSGGGEEYNATGMSDGEGGGGVPAEKKFLNAQDVGVERINEAVEFGVDFKQAVREGGFGGGRNNAEMKWRDLSVMSLDKSKAANGRTGVDTERDHNS